MGESLQTNIVCRVATHEELPQVMKLWETCFDDTIKFVLWYFSRYWKAEHTLCIYEQRQTEDVLQASAQVIPYELQLRNANISCGYIVGVDTAPEARNKGYAKRLLKECLKMQKDNQQVISLLMPFEGQFYYRYGWPFCYFHQRLVIEPQELRCIAQPWGTVRKTGLFEAQRELESVYRQFVECYHGTVNRSAEQWRLQLEDAQLEHTACFLIEDEQHTVQGYFLWTPLKGKCFVREMAWCHERAKRGMLHYLMKNVAEGEKLWLELPDDDDLKYHLAASKTDIVLYPFLMARVVDVEQCLKMLSYPPLQENLLLTIEDAFAEWNTGSYYLETQNGQVRVSKVTADALDQLRSSGIYEVAMSIDSLSQLVMGARSAADLMRHELLDCQDAVRETIVQVLNQLWPEQKNYINEYY
ncbi:MAG: GNAT family N-acetyltransferase [Peptococcaceae bacterium]|nr:GNAT family N-acetyltransferase [Peptococcaceae bacterium]